jgi:hypothetical protein
MDFMNLGHFWIQQIHVFQETSLQILSDSDGVMRFGTKIFIFTACVYSQMLRLHENCAYVFSSVKEYHSQNTVEKFWYISLTLQISQFLFPLVTFSAHVSRACTIYCPFYKLFILTLPFNELHTRALARTHAHARTHACPPSNQIWGDMTSSGLFMHYKTHCMHQCTAVCHNKHRL